MQPTTRLCIPIHDAGIRLMLRQLAKPALLLAGIALVAWGYRLLSIPPDAGHEVMLQNAKNGMLSVVIGGTMLMTWLAKR